MDALVDGLLEELDCDVVFKIPIFGGIPIYESVVVTSFYKVNVSFLYYLTGKVSHFLVSFVDGGSIKGDA